jgi:Ca-activated chloride channel family protein
MTPPPITRAAHADVQRRRSRVKRTVVASVAVLAVGAVLIPTVRHNSAGADQSLCSARQQPLRVVTAPEIAPVVSGVLQVVRTAGNGCRLPIVVVPEDPALTAAALRQNPSDGPDVWIPDSGLWADSSGVRPPGSSQPSSIASSPLTIALSPIVARKLSPHGERVPVTALLPRAPGTAGPIRWALSDPQANAATVGAILALQSAVSGRTEATGLLETTVRASESANLTLATLTGRPNLGLPVSEQQLFYYNATHSDAGLTAAYAPHGFVFDYPYLVLTTERSRVTEAGELRNELAGELGRNLLDASGFRAPDGVPGPTLKGDPKIDAAVAAGSRTDERAVRSALTTYSSILRPSRLLAVIDVSGSMGRVVPGAGGATRLRLAAQAAVNGLAVYSDDTVVGLWSFATDLTRTTDYRVEAPLGSLGRGPDGVTGRERLARVLAGLQVSKGKTGLNDTVLAAVREVRRTWDPERVNSIVVISDGSNNDPHGISLPQLIKVLRAENDPRRPVAIFGIAYGPKAGLAAMREISEATNGKAYASPDPRQISKVLQDAIGRRACAPHC